MNNNVDSSRGMTGNTRNAKDTPGPPSSDPKSPLDPRQLRRGFQSWHFGADFVRKAKIRVEKISLFLPTDAHRCPPMPAWLPMAKNTRNPIVVYCENKVVKNFLIFRDVHFSIFLFLTKVKRIVYFSRCVYFNL